MAPLGEWSLGATILDGARGRPTPSVTLTARWAKIFQLSPGGGSGGFRVQPAVAHWVAVALGERTQLAQGKRPAAAALGDEDPRPQALRAWQFACLSGAHPSARAGPADGLGFCVPRSGPSFWILGARAYRCLFPSRCGHRCYSSARSAASRRDGTNRSVQTIAMQQLVVRARHEKLRAGSLNAAEDGLEDLITSDNSRVQHRCNCVALIRLSRGGSCSPATYRSGNMGHQAVAVRAGMVTIAAPCAPHHSARNRRNDRRGADR